MPQDIATLNFNFEKRYKIKNDGSRIILEVIIGDKGQSPDISVKLDAKKLIDHQDVSLKNFLVGTDTDLDDKILKIAGNVVDTAKDSNKIDVTLKLKGGVDDFSKKFSVTVEEEGERVELRFFIRFKS